MSHFLYFILLQRWCFLIHHHEFAFLPTLVELQSQQTIFWLMNIDREDCIECDTICPHHSTTWNDTLMLPTNLTAWSCIYMSVYYVWMDYFLVHARTEIHFCEMTMKEGCIIQYCCCSTVLHASGCSGAKEHDAGNIHCILVHRNSSRRTVVWKQGIMHRLLHWVCMNYTQCCNRYSNS